MVLDGRFYLRYKHNVKTNFLSKLTFENKNKRKINLIRACQKVTDHFKIVFIL